MPSFVRATWPIPLLVAGFFLVMAEIGRSGDLLHHIPASIGVGLSTWAISLLVVWGLRSVGRLKDEAASKRGVWLVSIVWVVLQIVGIMSDRR